VRGGGAAWPVDRADAATQSRADSAKGRPLNTPYAPRQEVDFRTLISRSFENLWLIRKEIAIFLAIIAVAAFTLPLLGQSLASGAGFVSYFVGQYWLYQTFLKARGMLETPRYHLISFIALGLVLILPITFGLVAFLLPGLFLVARWIAAPAYVVAGGRGSFAAAADSWRAVRGHTGKVAGAAVVMFLIVTALSSLTGAIDGQLGSLDAYRETKPIDLIEFHFLPLLLLGLSTATYELLGPRNTMIEEVFG
jgi:hypothetical protein